MFLVHENPLPAGDSQGTRTMLPDRGNGLAGLTMLSPPWQWGKRSMPHTRDALLRPKSIAFICRDNLSPTVRYHQDSGVAGENWVVASHYGELGGYHCHVGSNIFPLCRIWLFGAIRHVEGVQALAALGCKIVIRSRGRRCCARKAFDEDAQENRSSICDWRTRKVRRFGKFTKPWRVSRPVIASAHGHAIGKGFELVLPCEVTVVASGSRLGYKEVQTGIFGHGMVLPWHVRRQAARVLTGLEITAAERKELDLFNEIAAQELLAGRIQRKATRMAGLSREIQPMQEMHLNRVCETLGSRTATDYNLEPVAIMGAQRAPEYAGCSRMTREERLRAALEHATARCAGLDGTDAWRADNER